MPAGFCPQCWAARTVAPLGSPTCPHHPAAGLKFWPENWAQMEPDARVKWLESVKRAKTGENGQLALL